MRFILASLLLFFAWKGSDLSLLWPPSPPAQVEAVKPEAELLAWAEPLRPVLPRILPKDRQYLAALYDAMAYVIVRDGERDSPIINTTEQFANFHAGTLRLAIDKASVGKYDGLSAGVDQAFVAAAGAEIRPIDPELRKRLIAACGVLSWSFGVKRDE